VADIIGKPEGLTIVKEFLNKRQISTPCWLRKCSSSSFLPHTPSAFQQARRRDLVYTVLLGRAAIFSHKEDNGLQNSPRASCPCEKGGDGCDKPTSQRHTCIKGKLIEKIRNFLEWRGGNLVRIHQVGGCGFSSRGFDTRDCCFLGLRSSRLRGC
jgi:hypothetical protein